MGVTLYTSRIVLEVLGATNYGLYYAIFSIIGLLSFLTGTLSAGTSRFITYEIGTGNSNKLKTTFSTALYSHALLGFIIIILGETIGLWYAYNVLVVPDGSQGVALIVYQISIISTVISIIQIPFVADIIAHERMNAFAYIGIYEAVAKLVVLYFLVETSANKLLIFAFLQLLVAISVFFLYFIYSFTQFKEVTVKKIFDKYIFKEILKFSGWNIIANISETLMSQGIIMLYNIFFMPFVVAAQAIANQISRTMMQFVNNVRQAVNPQVIKLYADNNHRESQRLTFISAEYVFYLLLILGVPCIVVMPMILNIWLTNVPDYTVAFARLIIAQQILGNFSSAFYTPMLAANKLAKNSIASVFLCIFQFLVLWLLFKIGFGPLWARYLGLFSAVCFSFIVKPYILWKDVNYNLKEIGSTILKCMKVLAEIIFITGLTYISIKQTNIYFSILCGTLTFIETLFVCVINIKKTHRKKLILFIRKKLKI